MPNEEPLIPYPCKGKIEIFGQKRFVNFNAQLYENSVSWRQREPSDFSVMKNLLLWNSFDSFYGWLVLYDFVKLHKIEGPSHLCKCVVVNRNPSWSFDWSGVYFKDKSSQKQQLRWQLPLSAMKLNRSVEWHRFHWPSFHTSLVKPLGLRLS